MKILKKISRNVLSVVLLYILTACTNESLVEEHNELASYLEKGVYTFFYHGKSYSSEYVVLQDSSCLFKNKEVANLMEYYKSAPEVAVLVLNNGGYEYFDSEKELNDSLSVRTKLEGALSRSSVNFLKDASVTIYEDTGFKGRNYTYSSTAENLPFEKSSLWDINMNDKISAFKFTSSYKSGSIWDKGTPSCRLTFYSDTDFQQFSLTYVVNSDHPYIEHGKLKDVKPFGPYFKKNWNDKISSFNLK